MFYLKPSIFLKKLKDSEYMLVLYALWFITTVVLTVFGVELIYSVFIGALSMILWHVILMRLMFVHWSF